MIHSKARDNRIDSIKGVLIILVIIGHLMGRCGTGMINEILIKFIYTFHMPLFILISGYLTKIDSKVSFWRGIKNIALPLVVFQILNAVMICAQGNGLSLSLLFIPYWTLWYLLSLIFWRILLLYTPNRLLLHPKLYLAICICISLICGFMHGGRIFSVQRTFNFYPFFLYGFYMKNNVFPTSIGNRYVSYLFLSVLLGLIVIGLYPDDCLLLLRGADHYGRQQLLSKAFLLFCAYVASISFYNIIKEDTKIFSVIGRNSLFYYLFHGLIIECIILPLIIEFKLPQTFLYILVYTVFTVSFISFLRKISFCRWLIKPDISKYICYWIKLIYK